MKQVDFEHGSILSNMFQTAFPMLVAQVLNLLYSIVDRIYISRIPGEGTAALGGIGLCFPVIILVAAFTNLYGSGGAPLCAIARGRKETDRASDIMNTAFFMITATSLIIMLLGEAAAPGLLRLFGASDESILYALPYLRIYLLGTLFSMVSTGMNPYINAQGFSSIGMMTVVIGAVSNIILDPIFIFPLKMGVRGAALATILSQLLSAVFVWCFLRSSRAELRLRLMPPSEFQRHRKTALNIISLGTASFIMQFTNSLVQISCNSVLSHFGGDLYISIMTIVSSVRQILDTPVLAISDGASPVISYNYGAKRAGEIRKAIRVMTIGALIYTGIVWALILLRPLWFISIFSSDPAITQHAARALHIYFFAFVFQALQYSGQTVFKSLNKKRRAIFFSLFRKVVMVVPLTYAFPWLFGFGAEGVFMAEPVSNVIGGTACFVTMLLTILPELKALSPES